MAPVNAHLPRRAHAGFTLVELLVGLTVTAVITTAAIAVFLSIRLAALEGATRAQMARDAQLALDVLERDLLFFGAGVPLGVNDDRPPDAANSSPAAGQTLLPILRVARSDSLVFLGDLPYPNSELSGIASVSFITAGDELAVSSEVSGSCTPPATGAPSQTACSTAAASWIPFSTAPADCDENTPTLDSSAAAADFEAARTCPWGLHKWQLGAGNLVHLTLVDALGEWHERRDDGIGDSTPGDYFGNHLDHDFPTSGGHNFNMADFFGSTGGAYVTVMDRVFYSVEETATPGAPCAGAAGGDCMLRRRQCWGYLQDPGNAAFPAGNTTTFFHAGTAPLNCAVGNPPDGTGAELVLSGFENLSFTYFADASTQLAGAGAGAPLSVGQKGQVRAIEVELRLRRRVRGALPARFLSDVVKRRYVLPNQE